VSVNAPRGETSQTGSAALPCAARRAKSSRRLGAIWTKRRSPCADGPALCAGDGHASLRAHLQDQLAAAKRLGGRLLVARGVAHCCGFTSAPADRWPERECVRDAGNTRHWVWDFPTRRPESSAVSTGADRRGRKPIRGLAHGPPRRSKWPRDVVIEPLEGPMFGSVNRGHDGAANQLRACGPTCG
jgi:hypothetical protein